ncbi:ATP-binding protein [Streptomyces sp. NBC_00280]|uniref:ATP-binding protein n=1 Tax=Streptomyces sp. NBC_00280 TaxID=2975699 RepID=UPI003246C0A8
MSLPLTRRIARAALLVAAGAAAGVGAAGSASAAPAGLPATPSLGGLTALDTANVDAVTEAVPTTAGGDVLGDTAKTATKGGLPTDALPTKGLPGAGQLPLQGLPLG